MILFSIDGIPTPWAAHQGYGKRAYNPKIKKRLQVQWQIKSQFNQDPLRCPIKLIIVFHMPIPKATSKIRRRQMLDGRMHHMSRPDTTNMQKFLEDCLKGIVFEDDSQVVEVNAKKIYGEIPKTVVIIEPIR